MKQFFEKPELHKLEFDSNDMITTSFGESEDDGDSGEDTD